MSTIRRIPRRGFTIVEMLTVFFVIIVLAGLLLPALSGAFASGRQTTSIARLRQVGMWTNNYVTDNKDRVLPSQFDYSGPEYDSAFRGTVRSVVATEGVPFQGTWTDILWTENGLAEFPVEGTGGAPIVDGNGVTAAQYLFDSPDANFYAGMADLVGWNPANDDALRSAEPVTRDAPVPEASAGPLPYGEGARANGDPGYFAANDFFNVTADAPDVRTKFGFWSLSQIRQPDVSMFVVDSAYGEVIPPTAEAFELIDGEPGPDTQIDQRYGNSVLMLMLDGSVRSLSDWGNLDRLERGSGSGRVRVRDLADRLGSN